MDHHLGPDKPLPHSDEFATTEEYVDSLVDFVGSNDLLRTLCGGVHILDFFTSTPSLYSRVLPEEWRDFFDKTAVLDLLELLMREDLAQFSSSEGNDCPKTWRDGPVPPESLLDYIRTVRRHLLNREPSQSQCSRNRAVKPVQKLTRNVAVGMNVKKIHEVGIFAAYINQLTEDIAADASSSENAITHLVDFGSGQNYLGRALASEPYNKNIVAIESKEANTARAKEFDVMAKLVIKEKLARNKKAFRVGKEGPGTGVVPQPVKPAEPPTPPADASTPQNGQLTSPPEIESPPSGTGKIQYVSHRIADGDLSNVIAHMPTDTPKNLLVMSLHSCGNLVHHGLRSLVLNPEVKAVAMVGCCYNLVTERLGPATYKLPELRPTTHDHPRLSATGEACDPHGFPMSERMCMYRPARARSDPATAATTTPLANLADVGIRLNITSRMMAVQAPGNWGPRDSGDFFMRHYFRALLQRIFLDLGVIGPPSVSCVGGSLKAGTVSPAGHTSGGTPIVIGSLRKTCYVDFVAYVRGALAKLGEDPVRGPVFRDRVDAVITDDEIRAYDARFRSGKKDLGIIWSLMAFSAGVIEAAIVVDRWLWLREQDAVREAWVQPVFDYKLSPRNLVVVGVKR